MKKQYIFLFLIGIILYISYLILLFTYKEYQVSKKTENINKLILDIKGQIVESQTIIEYKTSRAFRNKILKEQQSFKNRGEDIKFFTPEKQYEKYTKPLSEIDTEVKTLQLVEKNEIYEMTIYERWMYFLFDKNS